jgi:hypothetical protein
MNYTHRELCKIAAGWCLKQPWCSLTSWELSYKRRSVLDVVALSSRPKIKNKRVAILEVKRTRSDLLQDLRKRKMLKYESTATHCYLAATKEALALLSKSTYKVLDDLEAKGLPPHWGILVLPTSPKDKRPYILKKARRIKSANTRTINSLIHKIALSMMYRVLNSKSPMSD